MIGQSIAWMTLIDLVILGITGAAVVVVWRARDALAAANALRAAWTLIFGLGLTGAFYALDLLTMHVLPLVTSPTDAMAAMESLHLNWNWIVSLAAAASVFLGFVGIVRSEVELTGELRSKEEARATVEAALAAAEHEFEAALRAAGMASWAFFPETGEFEWAESVGPIFGRPEGWRPRSREEYRDLLHPEERESVLAYISEALATGGAYSMEHRVVAVDGGVLWVRAQGWAYLDEEGQPTAMRGVVWDITSQKEAVQQREEAEASRLELIRRLDRQQRLESLGTLSGGIAHDFNNLLTPILGHVEMLREDTTDGDMLERLEQVGIAAERARGLVRQILAFGGRVEPTGGAVDAREIVEEALELVRATLPSTIGIETAIEPSGHVGTDSTQLTQVVVNLCTNASHAMPDGGTLRVGVDRVDIAEEDLESHPDLEVGRYVKITVGDTGVGMRRDVAERAFEPFFTTKEVGEGTGLGLSQVLGIVSTYDGAVMLFSDLDVGTTIDVFLPSVEPGAATEEPPAVSRRTEGGRVLLVDDEPAVSRLMSRMLQSLGFAVTDEANAVAALARFGRSPAEFDLVITDQTMPGMTGAGLVGRVRAISPDIPIILMSGFTDPDHVLESDVVFLMKPFTRLQLDQALAAALGDEGPVPSTS